MTEVIWKLIALICARPTIAAWLIRRAQRTPYFHLDGYMERWWLFNPVPNKTDSPGRRFEWLPSIRVHHILREDRDRHPHNHPWDARTIILRGWYCETRGNRLFVRSPGCTAKIAANDFHLISTVAYGGVWTLFFSWGWQHVWGFQTEQGFVPWREYLGQD